MLTEPPRTAPINPLMPISPMSGVMMISGARRMPATAASTEPTAQISEKVWSMLTPTRVAASGFCDVASMPLPSLVRRKNTRKTQHEREGDRDDADVSGVSAHPEDGEGSVENNAGNRLTSGPRTMRTPARMICPTATVARITVMTGAKRSGRNAMPLDRGRPGSAGADHRDEERGRRKAMPMSACSYERGHRAQHQHLAVGEVDHACGAVDHHEAEARRGRRGCRASGR